jgi:hypothetical protein
VLGSGRVAKRSTRLFALSGVLVLAFAASAQASAGDDAHVVTQQAAGVTDTNDGTAIVRCPTNEIAIGGGERRYPLNAGDHWLLSTGPWTADGAPFTGLQTNQWRTRVHNNSGEAGSSTYAMYAICSDSSDAVIQTVDTSSVAADDGVLFEGKTAVMCPAGQRALGGGLFPDEFVSRATAEQTGPVDETGTAANLADGDVPRGWFIEARTQESGHTMRAYAICTANSTATMQVESLTLGPNTNGELAAICPSGQRALSGGVVATTGDSYSSIKVDSPANSSGGPLSVETVAGGWLIWINNYKDQKTYQVAVVCEGPSPPSDPTHPTNPPTPIDPIPPATQPPSNAFEFGKFFRDKDKGRGALVLNVPGPGTVALESSNLVPQANDAFEAGDVGLTIKAASGKARHKLNRTGKLKAKAKVTYLPDGGSPDTEKIKLKLIHN